METPMEYPFASLERAYIDEYLRSRGLTLEGLHKLPEGEAHKLMQEASTYASCKLEEIHAKDRELRELAGIPEL